MSRRVDFYSLYERIWHWLQALSMLGLFLTGIEMHWPGTVPWLGFAGAVTVHSLLGFLLVGNALLALFYHLATGEIRQYLPDPEDFVTMAVQQARYYLRGIFRGAPHPFGRSPLSRLNPLQKITYLVILNLLLPLQILSGFLMWGAQRWPDWVASLGGLSTLAHVHSLGAWLFAAFMIAHVYLATTGPTPLALFRTMVVGWDETADHHPTEGHPHAVAASVRN